MSTSTAQRIRYISTQSTWTKQKSQQKHKKNRNRWNRIFWPTTHKRLSYHLFRISKFSISSFSNYLYYKRIWGKNSNDEMIPFSPLSLLFNHFCQLHNYTHTKFPKRFELTLHLYKLNHYLEWIFYVHSIEKNKRQGSISKSTTTNNNKCNRIDITWLIINYKSIQ